MIVDACLYAGEVEMLELRLRTLAPVVDQFAVVTCDRTHQGERAWFAPQLPALATEMGNVWTAQVRAGRLPQGERGGAGTRYYQAIERQHRDGVRRACEMHGVEPETIVMVSDVDEIPHPRAVQRLGRRGPVAWEPWLTFEQRFHSSALDLLHPQQPWYGTCVALMSGLCPQAMRDARTTISTDTQTIGVMPHAGWHFSWFGTDVERQTKLDTFSHAELRGRFDPAAARALHEHANGESLRQLSMAELQSFDWPAPIMDGTFIPPRWWFA